MRQNISQKRKKTSKTYSSGGIAYSDPLMVKIIGGNSGTRLHGTTMMSSSCENTAPVASTKIYCPFEYSLAPPLINLASFKIKF